MADKGDDGFDEIVNGGADDETTEVEFDHIMEAVEYFWRKFNPGHIFVKGVILVESVAPEGRGLSLETSSPITDADILGFCEWGKAKILADINAVGWIDAMDAAQSEDDADEAEDADDD